MNKYKAQIHQIEINVFSMCKETLYTLPVAIFVVIAVYLGIMYYQKKKQSVLEKKKRNAIILLFGYAAIMLQISIFSRDMGKIREVDLVPFDLPGGINLIALYAVANAVVFIPLGILTTIIFEERMKLPDAIILGLSVSLCVEIMQYIFSCGVSQTEDLLMNTIGTAVGYWLYRKKTFRRSRECLPDNY